jgi:DNA-binding NarL/FixJ family response regulator
VARIRVLLADDHAVVREGLKNLVSGEADIEVVGEARDGAEAVSRATELRPDVVVMDMSMPRMSGAEATRRLRQTCPSSRVLVLTVHEDQSFLRQLLSAGAAGYVLKRAAGDELIHAVRAVASGGTYLDPAIAGKLVGQFVEGAPAGVHGDRELSERESEVLRLIAQGYSNKEIAAQLAVSVKTVETYRARSMEKLGLESRVDIVRYAIRRGWLHES